MTAPTAIPTTAAFRPGIEGNMLSAKEIALLAVLPSNINVMPNRHVARNAGRLIR